MLGWLAGAAAVAVGYRALSNSMERERADAMQELEKIIAKNEPLPKWERYKGISEYEYNLISDWEFWRDRHDDNAEYQRQLILDQFHSMKKAYDEHKNRSAT